jgi:Zn-dependent protease with chaperone function
MPKPISSSPAPEKPLPPFRYGLYLFLSSLLIAGFYLYSVVALLLATVIGLGLAILVVLVLRHAGLSGHLLAAFGGVSYAFAVSLRLRKDGMVHRIPLSREDGPELWSLIEDLARRIDVVTPDELVLTNGVDAWVQLVDVEGGRKRTRLGLGFDLMGGLTAGQVRAVLAHEMAHAKYVKRGYLGFLMKGLARTEQCSATLTEIARDDENGWLPRNIASLMGMVPRLVAKVGGRLVASCSRYDEFLADRVAAEICGGSEVAQALLTTHVLSEPAEKLSWRERLLHLEREPGYTSWLQDQLRFVNEEDREKAEAAALEAENHNELSTHPSLSDRILALDSIPAAEMDYGLGSTGNGVNLLRAPDNTARKLLRETERVMEEEERKATANLSKWASKEFSKPQQERRLYAACAMIGGFIILVPTWIYLADEGWTFSEIALVSFCIAFIAIAVGLLVKPAKAGLDIPVPSLSSYRAANLLRTEESRCLHQRLYTPTETYSEQKWKLEKGQEEEREARQQAVADECEITVPPDISKPREVARFWAGRGADFLSRCQYEEALYCSTLALKSKPKFVDATLVHGIALAFGGYPNAAETLDDGLKRSRTTTGRWAVAWGVSLLEQTEVTEAMLLPLMQGHETRALQWHLLAVCQSDNGRQREALNSFRRALQENLTQGPPEDEALYRFDLAKCLTSQSLLSEAKTELEWLQNKSELGDNELGDNELGDLAEVDAFLLQTLWMDWRIAHGDTQIAIDKATKLASRFQEPHRLIALCEALLESTDSEVRDLIRQQCHRVLEAGHYPQVFLMLSKLALDEGDKIEAKKQSLLALNASVSLPFDAVPSLAIFGVVLGLLRSIDGSLPCLTSGFIVHFDARLSPLDIGKISMIGFFSNSVEAKDAGTELFTAMFPDMEVPSKISWQRASSEEEAQTLMQPGFYDWSGELKE